MDAWEQPHWSGRPQPEPDRRPRLRPNIFARIARFCARQSPFVLIVVVFLTAMTAGFAALSLAVDPSAVSRIELDPQTTAAQQRLDGNFPGIDATFVARVDDESPDQARRSAIAIGVALAGRGDLFERAFVPGTGPYYAKYGILFREAAEIDARVTGALQMQPLYQALGQAPDLEGLAALVTEIGKAVAQGRSPHGLAELLLAMSASVEGELAGEPNPIAWPRLVGLSAELESKRWFVIATPVPAKEREAAAFAAAATKTIPDVTWSFPHQAYGGASNTFAGLIVPAVAALLIVGTVLGIGLGPARFVVPVLAVPAVTLCITAGAAAVATGRLDAVTWSFVAACLAPALLFSIVFILAHIQARTRGSEPLPAIMLAAHRRGALLIALSAIFVSLWSVWLYRQLPSLAQLAEIAVVGTLAALAVSLTLIPALLALLDRGEPVAVHWLDNAVSAPVGSNGRNALQMIVLVLVAAAVFCTVFVPGIRFGDAIGPALPASELDSLEAQGAIHLLAKDQTRARQLVASVAKLEQTGAIRTIEQFLPPGLDRKLQSLKRLEAFLPGIPALRTPMDDAALSAALVALDQGLRQIAAEPATASDLRGAAHRLRRAFSLYSNPQLPPVTRLAALQDSLFSGLAGLSQTAGQLAKLGKPGVADLDDGLRRRFVAANGLLRIEVLPKPEASKLTFAAAVRRIDPQAAGTPIVALARNEIMHHEAAIAFAMAIALVAFIVLLLLRNVAEWFIALMPAALALSLSAAAVVGAGQSLTSAALGAAMTSLALCLSSSVVLVLRARQSGGRSPTDTSFRSALLPSIAVLSAVAPLAISTIAPVAATGVVSILFLCIAIVVTMIVVPQFCSWAAALRRR